MPSRRRRRFLLARLSRFALGASRGVALGPATVVQDFSPAARGSPAALRDAGHVPFERELAEAQAAERELSHVGARPAAQATPVAQPNLEFRRLLFLGD